MNQISLNTYLSRILSGFYVFLYKNSFYKLKYPGIDIKYRADIYAEKEYNDSRFNDWIKDDDILSILMSLGLWNPSLEKELGDMPTKIEDVKVELYKQNFNATKIKALKRQLTNLDNRYNYLYGVRHCYDHLTSLGYASSLKNQYILIHSLYDEFDNKLFTDTGKINFTLLNNLCNIIQENIIPSDIFRLIARSDLWRNYWCANKDNIFNKPTIDWTDEQKSLIIISKMYDNAYEHPECPADKIIEDDDIFDGWMINQRRESERDKNKKRTEKMLGDKLSKAGEVFIMANSNEEAQNIYQLNDVTAQQTIKERTRAINSASSLDVSQLPDVQRDITIEQNRLYKEKFKK